MPAALAAGLALQRLVEGMRPAGAATYGAMMAVLVAAALAAGLVPAWRAGNVNPVETLRQE